MERPAKHSITSNSYQHLEVCPVCEQPIPHDIAEEVLNRLRDKEDAAIQREQKRFKEAHEKELVLEVSKARKEESLKAAELVAQTRKDTEARMQEKVSKAESVAEDSKRLTEQLKASHENEKSEAVAEAEKEQREILDRVYLKKHQKEQASNFRRTQKLEKTVESLTRQLEEKTANELGEGAEIDLYEMLREQFEEDDINRVKKGERGADIIHEVRHNGEICGKIIYDSKNHQSWRNSFVEKLKKDQIAAKADHAILTTNAFPQGAQQLDIRNDVIVTNPARVAVLALILRKQIIRIHRLSLSNQERDEKTEELYKFITSEECNQLFDTHVTITEDLLQIDANETETHRKVWKKRGKAIKDLQKVHAHITTGIDHIIEDGSVE